MAASQMSNNGGPSARTACSIAMISASVELWLAAVCPSDAPHIGANVLGPTNAKHNHVVDVYALVFPAKSESVKSIKPHS